MSSDELDEDLLSAYADGELDDETRREVEARLASSERWRAARREIEEARGLVRGLPVRDAPPGFWAEATSAVANADAAADAATVVPLVRSHRRGRRVWQVAAGVAAAAVVAAVVLVPTRPRNRPPVATMVSTHAARSSLSDEPISQLAPVAGPVRFHR